MIFDSITLKPGNRIIKLILLPIFLSIGFALFVFITGYRGRYNSETPTLVQLDFSIEQILMTVALFLIIVFVIYRLILIETYDISRKLIIKSKMVYIDTCDYRINFNLSLAISYSFKTSRIWTKLYFDSYYRVAVFKINYQGDKYKFFFPVKNIEIEENILALNKR